MSHPLLGLVHTVDVIRKADADDGAGGVTPDGAETTVYSGRACRLTVATIEDSMRRFGQAGKRGWSVLLEHSPNVVEGDFIRVSWGDPPNDAPPLTGLPTWGKVMTPAGAFQLDSDFATPPTYTDGTYTLAFGAQWVFTHTTGSVNLGGAATDNPWALGAWPDAGDAGGYWVVKYGWGTKDFRVMSARGQIDETGAYHHTSVVTEYEDTD